MPRLRLTVRRMMVFVAVASVTMAAFRFHFSLGSFVACVSCLGLYRGYSRLDVRQEAFGPSSAWRSLFILFDSVMVSVLIVGASALVAVPTYYFIDAIRLTDCSVANGTNNVSGRGPWHA